jgi:hypothetical protein
LESQIDRYECWPRTWKLSKQICEDN